MPQNTNPDPLATLHDIIAPSPASWWPLPLIYWTILFTTVALLSILIYFIVQHQKKRRQQKMYLAALSALQIKGCDFITLNQLLKSISIASFPRSQVASLHGSTWYDFLLLNSSFEEKNLFKGRDFFVSQLYQQSNRECEESDFQQAKTWIKELPRFIKANNKTKKSALKSENVNV